MKKYKILTASSLDQAEQVMNDMAQAGWEVVSTALWPVPLSQHLAITLARES